MHGHMNVKIHEYVIASKYENVYTTMCTPLKLADKQNPYALVSKKKKMFCVSKCYTDAILTRTCKVILPEPDK